MINKLLFLGFFLAGLVVAAEPQPYDRVITKDAKTTKGIFTLHSIGDQHYYEIPRAELDKEFLWNVRVAKTTAGVGFGGFLAANLVVRWQLSGNRVLLRALNYSVTAAPKSPVAAAVAAANTDTIMMSFDVAALAPDGSPVIVVTKLFTADLAQFGIHARLGANGLDGNRSWIDRIATYPQNIEAEVTQTWSRYDQAVVGGLMRPGDATIVVHHSMVKLPSNPMVPRLYDDRVGFFQTQGFYYGADEQRAEIRSMINRWRLEKKDPNAAVSEPVKPIVYYIDAATPVKWRDWIRKGVEEWLPALESAGFRNAISARQAPEPSVDPAYSPDDIRYSVIRWLPSTTQNAFGPTVNDPRTGEILNATIEFYQNMMNMARNWYFVQAGYLDPGAAGFPLSDDAMGRAIQMVIAHEVGHTLGLEHNLKASSLYPAEKVRDKEWVHRMGFTPSVMDLVRFNYVAQPEDGIAVEDLAAHVGPYDRWAIHWGYAPIPGTAAPEAEKPVLDLRAREQDTTPWLRYTTLVGWGGSADAGELAEAVGDSDPVKSTALGLFNLRRVEKMLIPGVASRAGVSMDSLAEMYGALTGQWAAELNHVVASVGGARSQAKHGGQAGRVFTAIPGQQQRQAVSFVIRNAFATPTWLLDAEVLRRIESSGATSRIRNTQAGILNNLLDSGRFGRIVEQQAIEGRTSWGAAEFLTAVRTGIWSELRLPRVKIDVYRRNLQRVYLEIAANRLSGPGSDEKSLYASELKALDEAIAVAMPNAQDGETKAHLEAVRLQISMAMEPRSAPVPAAQATQRTGGTAATGYASACFPDYFPGPDGMADAGPERQLSGR